MNTGTGTTKGKSASSTHGYRESQLHGWTVKPPEDCTEEEPQMVRGYTVNGYCRKAMSSKKAKKAPAPPKGVSINDPGIMEAVMKGLHGNKGPAVRRSKRGNVPSKKQKVLHAEKVRKHEDKNFKKMEADAAKKRASKKKRPVVYKTKLGGRNTAGAFSFKNKKKRWVDSNPYEKGKFPKKRSVLMEDFYK